LVAYYLIKRINDPDETWSNAALILLEFQITKMQLKADQMLITLKLWFSNLTESTWDCTLEEDESLAKKAIVYATLV